MIEKLYTKNYLDKIKQEQLFKFEDLYYIAEEIIKEKGLENYVYKIVSKDYPAYNFYDRKMELNLNVNSFWVKDFEEEARLGKVPVNYYNFLFLYAVLHELRHAEQKKILIEDYEKYDKYFLRNMITNTIRSYYYPCDHDKLYSEYDAFVNPMFDITKVGELTKAEEVKLINRNIARKLLYAYIDFYGNIKCPIEINEEVTSSLWKRLYADNQRIGEEYNSLYFLCEDAYYHACNTKLKPDDSLEERLRRGDTVENITDLRDVWLGKIETTDIIKTLRR